jgi:hypothetical protein
MKHNISTKKSKEFTPNSSKLIIIDHNWHYYVISEVPYVISENSYVISEARRFLEPYMISGGI